MVKFAKRMFAAMFACAFMVSVSACSTTATQATFNTAEFAQDASAAAYLAKTIEGLGLDSKLSASEKATFDGILTDIQNISAEVAANSGGSISVTIGSGWAKNLASDVSSLLKLAEPLVQEYAPKYVTYVTTAEAIVPLIQALVISQTSAAVAPAVSVGASAAAPMVRARIYQGV